MGAGAAFTAGTWIGSTAARQPTAGSPRPGDADASGSERDYATTLALGPIADLRAEGHYFLAMASRYPEDPRLWIGIERLAWVALVEPEESGRSLAAHIVSATREQPFASRYPELYSRLGARAADRPR